MKMSNRLFKKYVQNIHGVIMNDYHYINYRFKEINCLRHAVVSQSKTKVNYNDRQK